MRNTIRFIILFFLSSGPSFAQEVQLDSLYEEGVEALQSYQFQKALDIFFECQRNDPFNPEYLSQVGYCYFQTGNLQESRTYFSEVLKADSLHLRALNYLVTIEEKMMDYPSAIRRVEDLIRLDSLNGYYYRKAGDLSERLNEREQALQFYHQAIQLNPNDQDALISMCDVLAEEGYLFQADSMLETALQKQPGNLRLLYESAKLNYRLRTYEDVIPRFEKSLEMGDTNLSYLPLLPFALSQMERCDEAIPWFEYYLKHKKPNEQVHYFLGFCYMKLDSIEKSIQHYDWAIEEGISPNVAIYYQHKGDMMSEKKEYREALKLYDIAREYGNKDPVIYFHMAVAYDHLYKKDKKRPLGYYKQYLERDESNNREFRDYARRRVEEIEYYEEHIWKGH